MIGPVVKLFALLLRPWLNLVIRVVLASTAIVAHTVLLLRRETVGYGPTVYLYI